MAPKTPNFVDIGGPDGLPEDARITMIGNQAMLGKKVGVLLDPYSINFAGNEVEDPEKIDRYITRVLEKYPKLEVTFRGPYFKDGSLTLITFEKKGN